MIKAIIDIIMMRRSVLQRLHDQLEKAQHDRLDHMQKVEDHGLALDVEHCALATCETRINRLKAEINALTPWTEKTQ